MGRPWTQGWGGLKSRGGRCCPGLRIGQGTDRSSGQCQREKERLWRVSALVTGLRAGGGASPRRVGAGVGRGTAWPGAVVGRGLAAAGVCRGPKWASPDAAVRNEVGRGVRLRASSWSAVSVPVIVGVEGDLVLSPMKSGCLASASAAAAAAAAGGPASAAGNW